MQRPPVRRRGFVAVAAAAAMVGSLPACSRGDDSLERVRERGTLRFGVALEPPYALLLPNGEPAGESPGVARAVAAALGLPPAWTITRFERLLAELRDGRFDVIAAGLFVNAERAQAVRFCRPQLRVRAGWLVAPGNPAGLGPYATLGPGGSARLAVLAGSVEEAFFVRRGLPAPRLLRVPDARSGAAAVATGAADALALSWPSVSQLAQASQGALQAVPASAPGEPTDRVAMAVRRDDAALQQAIDGALERYLGSAGHLALLAPLGLLPDDVPKGADARL